MSSPGFFSGETTADGINGVVIGIVTDNQDPKDLGRVKLQFPWREADDESYWARLATLMAGDQYGTYCLPEVDDEVLVAFENGDIHSPYVVGALWNGEQKPPQQNDGENNIREMRSRSEHRLTFDDDEDNGGITIETAKGHEISIDDSDGKEKIRIRDKNKTNSITLDPESDSVAIEAGKEIELSAQTITLDGSKQVKINGGATVDIASKNALSLSGGSVLDVESSGLMNINATGPLSLRGAIIRLN